MEKDDLALRNRIEGLRSELYQIQGVRDGLNLESRRWAEDRDRINKSFKASISNVRELKAKLRILNERISALRASLHANKERYREKKVQLQNLNNILKDFRAKGLRMGGQELEDEIERIDWRIQTTSLPIGEEKMLVEQVKLLESQLMVHKQIGKLRDEADSLRVQMGNAYQEIVELSGRRERLREDMLNSSKRASEFKSEADKMHKKYLGYKDQAHDVHLKCVEVLNQIKTLEQEIAKIEAERKAKRVVELESDLERKALEKLKSRKKLTFDEFKLLTKKGKL